MSKILNAITYYIVILPLSFLPFGVLYVFSDFIYFLIYKIIGYRKEVVRQNLQNSFPEKSLDEIVQLEKKFYHHFSDLIVESLKAFTITDKAAQKRCAIANKEVIEKYFDEGKDLVVLCGHYNNWELYAVGLAQQMQHKVIAAYRPLSNTYFDEKMRKSRSRFGMKLFSMRALPRFLAEKDKYPPTMTILVNDQSPGNPKTAYWNTFLHQETGWFTGAEKIARNYNQVVLFGSIHKKKRGFYEVQFTPITDHPDELPKNEIIEKHSNLLEKIIKDEPQYWLWSHRRWKHRKPTL